jgi:curli biogenesis system outer membrane secretion channel CsgG
VNDTIRRMAGGLLGLLLLQASCASAPAPGRESFAQGQQLLRRNRVDEAIVKFEEALAAAPGNERYQGALERARQTRDRKPPAAPAGTAAPGERASFEQLKQARAELERRVKAAPKDREARARLEEVSLRMKKMDAAAAELVAAATRAAEGGQWLAAVRALREAAAAHPTYPGLADRLQQAENRGCAHYLAEADRHRAAEEWPRAVEALVAAQEIAPARGDVATALAEAKSRQSPEYFIARAEALVQQGAPDRLLPLLLSAAALNPDAAQMQRLRLLGVEAANAALRGADADPRRIHPAYAAVTLAMRFGERPGAGGPVDQVAELLYRRAEAYQGRELPGNALVWYEKLAALSPEYRDVFARTQAVKDQLRERVVKKVAVMDFSSPSANAEAGRILTDSLLSALTSQEYGTIKVLARDVLGSLLKEIEMGQTGLYDIQSAKKAGKLKGTDYFIFGSVLQYNVEKNTSEGYKSQSVVVGREAAPLPPAKRGRTAPPPPAGREVRETVRYKVATEKKSAFVKVSYRLIDVEEGEVITAQTLKAVREASDDYSEGVASANIPYDPLEVPSDTELLDQAAQEVVTQLGKAVFAQFENPQGLAMKAAGALAQKREYEKAIERYVEAIRLEEMKGGPGPVAEEARKEIAALLAALAR